MKYNLTLLKCNIINNFLSLQKVYNTPLYIFMNGKGLLCNLVTEQFLCQQWMKLPFNLQQYIKTMSTFIFVNIKWGY